MARFILRYRGNGPMPAADLARIWALPELEVVDQTARMLLVEAPVAELRAALAEMPDWVLARERTVGLPEPMPGPRE